MENKEWCLVYSFGQLYLAEIAKEMLADNQINAVIMNKQDSAYPSIGDIEIYVNNHDKQKAIDLLAEFNHHNK